MRLTPFLLTLPVSTSLLHSSLLSSPRALLEISLCCSFFLPLFPGQICGDLLWHQKHLHAILVSPLQVLILFVLYPFLWHFLPLLK